MHRPSMPLDAFVHFNDVRMREVRIDNKVYIEIQKPDSRDAFSIAVRISRFYEWDFQCLRIETTVDGIQVQSDCVEKAGNARIFERDLRFWDSYEARIYDRSIKNIQTSTLSFARIEGKHTSKLQKRAFTPSEQQDIGTIQVTITPCKHAQHIAATSPRDIRAQAATGNSRVNDQIATAMIEGKGLTHLVDLQYPGLILDPDNPEDSRYMGFDALTPQERCTCEPSRDVAPVTFIWHYRSSEALALLKGSTSESQGIVRETPDRVDIPGTPERNQNMLNFTKGMDQSPAPTQREANIYNWAEEIVPSGRRPGVKYGRSQPGGPATPPKDQGSAFARLRSASITPGAVGYMEAKQRVDAAQALLNKRLTERAPWMSGNWGTDKDGRHINEPNRETAVMLHTNHGDATAQDPRENSRSHGSAPHNNVRATPLRPYGQSEYFPRSPELERELTPEVQETGEQDDTASTVDTEMAAFEQENMDEDIDDRDREAEAIVDENRRMHESLKAAAERMTRLEEITRDNAATRTRAVKLRKAIIRKRKERDEDEDGGSFSPPGPKRTNFGDGGY